MKKLITIFGCLSLLAQPPQVHAVSEAAVLFLLIQPSVAANGMAGVSVAGFDHGPMLMTFNPAHAGLAAFDQKFAGEFYPAKTNWLPQFNIEVLDMNAKSIFAGHNFGAAGGGSPMSIGVGYSRVFLNLGEQIITGETSPEPIGVFNSSDHADIWTVGFGFDFLLQLGFGFSYKRIHSNLPPVGVGLEMGSVGASANAFDFGFIAQLPILSLYTDLTQNQLKLSDTVRPFLLSSLGYSIGNIGSEITYVAAAQPDPLPRVARLGIGFNAGLIYVGEQADLTLAGLQWSSEAEDLLVSRAEDGQIDYQGALGDIGFFNNVLFGNAKGEVISRQGWQLNLLDVVFLQRGDYDDIAGRVSYNTTGFGISFVGALRALREFDSDSFGNSPLAFIIDHFDVRYHHSSIDAGRGTPLDNTHFNGIRLSFF